MHFDQQVDDDYRSLFDHCDDARYYGVMLSAGKLGNARGRFRRLRNHIIELVGPL